MIDKAVDMSDKTRPPRAGLSNYALRDSNQRLIAERDALRAENERLRAALEEIASNEYSPWAAEVAAGALGRDKCRDI